MILALSRFKVANGREASVREAFLNRPHLVDNVNGFLGLEVFTDIEDASVFYLLTRWTDAESFQQWHAGPLHTLGHQQIPKGLKLDASFTMLRTMERLLESDSGSSADHARDAAGLIDGFISASITLHWIKGALDGTIMACNSAVEQSANRLPGSLKGVPIGEILTDPDAATLLDLIGQRTREPHRRLLLNLIGREQAPFTLACHLDVQPDGFLLIGEPEHRHDAALEEELIGLNNRLSVLLRENERKSKALRKAKIQLEKSLEGLFEAYRHLQKIQEVLPICMTCGKVKTGESKWEDVVVYLKTNSLFLSHGYCPSCLDLELDALEHRDKPGS